MKSKMTCQAVAPMARRLITKVTRQGGAWRRLIALLVAVCGLQVFATTAVGDALVYTSTNLVGTTGITVDGAKNTGPFKITIPYSDELPPGSVVTLQSVKFAVRAEPRAYLVLSDSADSSKASTNKTYSSSTTFGGCGSVEYKFNDLELTVGTTYPAHTRDNNTGSATTNTENVNLMTFVSGYQAFYQPQNATSRIMLYEIKCTVKSIATIPTSTIASTETSKNFKDLVWTPPVTSFTKDTNVEVVNESDAATLSFSEAVTLGYLYLESASGKKLTLANVDNATVSAYDLSEVYDGITIDATSGYTPTATSTFTNYLANTTDKVIFKGSGSNGATLKFSDTTDATRMNKTINGHWVFDGGTHEIDWANEQPGLAFGANASEDDPTFYVINGAKVTYKARNPCGWTHTADTAGIIRIGPGSTFEFATLVGTQYWSQRLYIDPSGTNTISGELRLNGGTTEGNEQLYVPASDSGTEHIAVINAGSSGSINLIDNSPNGAAAFVGSGSTLRIESSIKGAYPFVKRGAGEIAFPNGYGATGTISVEAGTFSVAGNYPTGATTISNGATLSLWNGSEKTCSAAISGAGNLAKAGSGLMILSGSLSLTGTTTISEGTLRVAAGSEGTISVASGAKLQLVLTDVQRINGYTASGLSGDGAVEFLNTSGEVLTNASSTKGTYAAPYNTIEVTESTTTPIDFNTAANWSEKSVPSSGTARIKVSEKVSAVINVSAAVSLDELIIDGAGTVTFTSSDESSSVWITATKLTLMNGAIFKMGTGTRGVALLTTYADAEGTVDASDVTIDEVTMPITVPADGTVNLIGRTSSALAFSGTMTINGTLKTSGKLSLSNTSNSIPYGGKLFVENGETELTVAGKSIVGTVEIAHGAKLINKTTDCLKWDTTSSAPANVIVRGELEMSNSRMTFGAYNYLTVYTGAEIKGTSDVTSGDKETGAIDNSDGYQITVLKADGYDTVTWSANTEIRTTTTLSIASGATVNMSGKILKAWWNSGCGTITKTGDGSLRMSYDSPNVNLAVNGGYLRLIGITPTGSVSVSDGMCLELAQKDASTAFTFNKAVSGSGNARIVAKDSTVTIQGLTKDATSGNFTGLLGASGSSAKLIVDCDVKAGVWPSSDGKVEIPENVTLDATSQSLTKENHAKAVNATTGAGTLKFTIPTFDIISWTDGDKIPIVVDVNLEYTGSGTLYLVGEYCSSAQDTFTINAGKTVSIASGLFWCKRSKTYINGTLNAKTVQIGHEASGDYPGLISVGDGGTLKTESVKFMNYGASGTKSSLSVAKGGTLEFTQNDSSAIAKVDNATYEISISGTLKASDSSWHVDSGIAMTMGDVTIATTEGNTITFSNEPTWSGAVTIDVSNFTKATKVIGSTSVATAWAGKVAPSASNWLIYTGTDGIYAAPQSVVTADTFTTDVSVLGGSLTLTADQVTTGVSYEHLKLADGATVKLYDNNNALIKTLSGANTVVAWTPASDAVASITSGETTSYYGTLQAAVDAASAGTEIVLMKDASANVTVNTGTADNPLRFKMAGDYAANESITLGSGAVLEYYFTERSSKTIKVQSVDDPEVKPTLILNGDSVATNFGIGNSGTHITGVKLVIRNLTYVWIEPRTNPTEVDSTVDLEVESGASVQCENTSDTVTFGNLTGAGTLYSRYSGCGTYLFTASGEYQTTFTGSRQNINAYVTGDATTKINSSVIDTGLSLDSSWRGTVDLAEKTTIEGLDLNKYGNADSILVIKGIGGGWVNSSAPMISVPFVLDGDFSLTALSEVNYSFASISGTGDFSISDSNSKEDASLTIVAVTNYTGTIANSAAVNLAITTVYLEDMPEVGTAFLKLDSTRNKVTLTTAKVGDTSIAFVKKDDGFCRAAASVAFDDGTTTNYATYAEAIAAAGSANVITALSDGAITVDDSMASFKIQKGSYTVTASGTYFTVDETTTDNVTTFTVTRSGFNATRKNPVTGADQTFVHAYIGTADATWDNVANWKRIQNNTYATEMQSDGTTAATKAPGVTGCDMGTDEICWGAMLLDGEYSAQKSVEGTTLEGYQPKYGLFNGMTVTVTMVKDQAAGSSWFMIDDTSKLIFKSIGYGNGTSSLYVSAKEGAVFEGGYKEDAASINYYFAGEGSVKFDGEVKGGTHKISEVYLSDIGAGSYKMLKTKTLITYASKSATFTTADAKVYLPDGTQAEETEGVSYADDIGDFEITAGDTGVVMTYVGYTDTPVAQVGETKYGTLEEAIDAAATTEDKAITLLVATEPSAIPLPSDWTLTISNPAMLNLNASSSFGGSGKVILAFSGNVTIPSDQLAYIKKAPSTVTFKFIGTGTGDAATGATLDFGQANTTLNTHLIFTGGKHTLKWKNDTQLFGANGTYDNPTVLVAKDTVLDFYGHDVTGYWSTDDTCIFRIMKGATFNMSKYGDGTVFMTQQVALDPGSTMNVTSTMDAKGLRFTGGTGHNQIYVADSTDAAAAVADRTATINIAFGKYLTIPADVNAGAGAYVGANSFLVINGNIGTSASAASFAKKGSGTLELTGTIDSTIDITIAAGTMKFTGENLTIGSNIAGEGNVVIGAEDATDSTITLSGVNAYTGTTTINSGTKLIAKLGAGLPSATVITINEGGQLQVDMVDFAQMTTTTAAYHFSGSLSENALEILNGDAYPWLSIGTSGDDLGNVVVDSSKMMTGLHISRICPKPAYANKDPNGRTSGWIELSNYGNVATNLNCFKIVRANMGKEFKASKMGALPSCEVAAGATVRVYTSEDYPTAEDHGGTGYVVTKYGHDDDGNIVENADNGIIIIPTKVNPKKFPMVRLYDADGKIVIDEIVVPADIDDDDIVNATTTSSRLVRSVTVNGTTTEYGPDACGLFGVKNATTDIAQQNTRDGFVPTGADCTISFAVNPFTTGGADPLEGNAIESVTLEYRTFSATGTMESKEATMTKADAADATKGWVYTGVIPSADLTAGALIQYRAKIVDVGGKTWYSPRTLNRELGHEWYGFVVQPTVAATVADTGICTNTLQTILFFGTTDNVTQMDKDINDQDLTVVPNGARLAVYDTQTHTYYDNVRFDLRGQTSAGFYKKSHGLRFNKIAPFTCKNPVDGDDIEIRKTSFMAEYGDPTYIRQALAFWVMRQAGVDAPFEYPVRLYLNGSFYQLAFHSNRFTDEYIEDYLGLNGHGYAYKNTETTKDSTPYYGNGKGCEKKTPDDDNEGDLSVLNSYTALFGTSDKTATQLDEAVMKKFDLPKWINYLAATKITQEADDVWTNLGIYINAYDEWYNPEGDDLMRPIAYDQNLSFGQWYYSDDEARTRCGIIANNDTMKSHPFYGGKNVKYHYNDGSERDAYNFAMEAVLQNATYRTNMVRRLRTLMDKVYGSATAEQADTPIWQQALKYKALIAADVETDHTKWEYTSKVIDSTSAIWVWSTALGFEDSFTDLWTNYIVPRRTHLYVTHAAANVGNAEKTTFTEVGYSTTTSAGIPDAQSATSSLTNLISVTTNNVALTIQNANAEAIDLSGWKLDGYVTLTLEPGTVVAPNSALYVVADKRAYVNSDDYSADKLCVVGDAVHTNVTYLSLSDTAGNVVVMKIGDDNKTVQEAITEAQTAGEDITVPSISGESSIVVTPGSVVTIANPQTGDADKISVQYTMSDNVTTNLLTGGDVAVEVGNNGVIDITPKATPIPTTMGTGATDGSVKIDIGTPVPGLFYVVHASTKNDFSDLTKTTKSDATQATNATDTVSLSVTPDSTKSKVYFFKVEVKATK